MKPEQGVPEAPPPITTKEWYWIHVAVKRFHDAAMSGPGDSSKSVWPEVMAAVDAHARMNPKVKGMLETEEKVRAEMAEEYSKTFWGRLFGPRSPLPPPDPR